MVEVLIPQKKGGLSGLFSGMQSLGQGASAYSNIMGAFGGGASGGSGAGLGAGGTAGKYGLGLKFGNVTAGGEAAAADTAGASAGGSSIGATAAEYAGPAVAIGTAAYQTQENWKNGKQGENAPIGVSGTRESPSTRSNSVAGQTLKAGRDINNEWNRFTSGMNLTGEKPDPMGAMERRMSTQQTAMQDIQAAQEQLNVAGLPTEERRRIGQKLELARQQIGGQNRGSRRIYT
jgi:hypothetical protein